jgi:hypothetical protein
MNRFHELAKKIVFRYSNIGKPTYEYGLEPIQLAEIINSIEELKGTEGNICEIGVARGMTSRFICEHISNQEMDIKYYCVDTFRGFVQADTEFETNQRNKKPGQYYGFAYNDYEKWKSHFAEFSFVEPIQCDVNSFDLHKIRPIKFLLLDVDLYRPTKSVLDRLPTFMVKGGIVMVDDVRNNHIWDGSYKAFMEFVEGNECNYRTFGNKGGLIRLPEK